MTQPGWIKFQHFFNADRALGLFIDKSPDAGPVSTTWGRRGDLGVRLFGGGNYVEAPTEDLAEITDGFGFRFDTVPTGSFWEAREGSTIHLQAFRNADGSISIWRGDFATGTLLATTDPGVAPMLVDLFFVINATIDDAAGTIDLFIDGTNRISEAAQDTQNGGTGVVNRHRWKGSGAGGDSEWSVKDIYCADAADADYHIMHDWRGERLAPDSDVLAEFTRSAGAANYETVDEVPFDSADKNTSGTTADRDRYGHAAGVRTEPIVSIAVIAQLAKDSGSASAKIGLLDGANLAQSDAILCSTTPTVHQLILTAAPVSGDPWDTTKRDAIVSDVENVS